MKYYLAGPMTYIPQFNFPAFFIARDTLSALGWNIQLPADMSDPEAVAAALASPEGAPGSSSVTWGQCLAKDVELIADHVQGLIFLPGWQKSRGARLEAFTGILCRREFRYFDPVTRVVSPPIDPMDILDEINGSFQS